MSIKINNKVIAGLEKPISYRYVGEIFQSAIPIDDPKVSALNGNIITEAKGYSSFIQYFISLVSLYPSLVCTEEEWQATVTKYGSCGKFVLNNNEIRLPKITGFIEGLNSLDDLGKLTEAGLPNITGDFTTASYSTRDKGAIHINELGGYNQAGGSGPLKGVTSVYFDASWSSPIYGKSETVQPQSIKYPYYIVLATGITQYINVKEDIMVNTPYSLLDVKWSDKKINNLSWLLSEGQYNSAELYPSVYELLEKEQSSPSIEGLSVKLTEQEITDYDFVINKTARSFRLPIKTKLAGGKVSGEVPVKGNGMTLGLYDKVSYYGLVGQNARVEIFNNQYGTQAGTPPPGPSASPSKSLGVTTDPTKSGLVADLSSAVTSDENLYLYYYVGETVKNSSLINISAITNKLNDYIKKNDCPAYIIESYINGKSGYNIYSNKFCQQWGMHSFTGAHGGQYTIKLLKEFRDTNYLIVRGGTEALGVSSLIGLTCNQFSTTQFSVHYCAQSGGSYACNYYWLAQGYLK